MQYLDSGQRNPSQALGTWLQGVMAGDVEEVRWQSGFFAADSLGIVQSALERMANNNQPVRALIGSNDQSTVRRDVERLVSLLGIPRDNAKLGVISYRDGYFHPKTFHVRRSDGTQAAYVGSANLTGSGVASLHVEAGVAVDSREGDSTEILDEIASAVDFWFDSDPSGLYRVSSPADVDHLVTQGVLAEIAPPRPAVIRQVVEGEARPTPTDRLRPLIAFPRLTGLVESLISPLEIGRQRSIVLPIAPRNGFPPYILFAPGLATPTSGITALSGSSLPMGAAGLVIRLNRDNSRGFDDRPGTANFSVPVPTLSTVRFGLYADGQPRPRAEFLLRMRFLTQERSLAVGPAQTNIMAYGFKTGERGHRDVRMPMPTVSIRALSQQISDAGIQLPQEGDLAFLEWPTLNEDHEFRLSFLDRNNDLFRQADGLFRQAQGTNENVGRGACWLPVGLSPIWQ